MAEFDHECRNCQCECHLNSDCEWPNDRPICWSCLWLERTDLLDALQELVDQQNGPPLATDRFKSGWQRAMDKARAAIAKALGVTEKLAVPESPIGDMG